MAHMLEISGFPFEQTMRGVYVHYAAGDKDKPDLLITCMGENDWECSYHNTETGDVIDMRSRLPSKESAVAWAKGKGYL